MLNIVLYTGAFESAGMNVKVEPFGNGNVATVGTINITNCVSDELCKTRADRVLIHSGYVWNEDGTKPPVIHQFDRLESLLSASEDRCDFVLLSFQ